MSADFFLTTRVHANARRMRVRTSKRRERFGVGRCEQEIEAVVAGQRPSHPVNDHVRVRPEPAGFGLASERWRANK